MLDETLFVHGRVFKDDDEVKNFMRFLALERAGAVVMENNGHLEGFNDIRTTENTFDILGDLRKYAAGAKAIYPERTVRVVLLGINRIDFSKSSPGAIGSVGT